MCCCTCASFAIYLPTQWQLKGQLVGLASLWRKKPHQLAFLALEHVLSIEKDAQCYTSGGNRVMQNLITGCKFQE